MLSLSLGAAHDDHHLLWQVSRPCKSGCKYEHKWGLTCVLFTNDTPCCRTCTKGMLQGNGCWGGSSSLRHRALETPEVGVGCLCVRYRFPMHAVWTLTVRDCLDKKRVLVHRLLASELEGGGQFPINTCGVFVVRPQA